MSPIQTGPMKLVSAKQNTFYSQKIVVLKIGEETGSKMSAYKYIYFLWYIDVQDNRNKSQSLSQLLHDSGVYQYIGYINPSMH